MFGLVSGIFYYFLFVFFIILLLIIIKIKKKKRMAPYLLLNKIQQKKANLKNMGSQIKILFGKIQTLKLEKKDYSCPFKENNLIIKWIKKICQTMNSFKDYHGGNNCLEIYNEKELFLEILNPVKKSKKFISNSINDKIIINDANFENFQKKLAILETKIFNLVVDKDNYV